MVCEGMEGEMGEVLVIAAPGASDRASAVVEALAGQRIDTAAPDLSAI
jgi:hypothetical protein